MTEEQLQQLIEQRNFPEPTKAVKRVETHASWVLLTDEFAYKLKKPIQYSFLDFSTLEKRKQRTEEELRLNRRLTDGVYLDVLPVWANADQVQIGGDVRGDIINYALKMRRLNTDRQMHKLLETGEVSPRQMEQLAEQLANFHAEAKRIRAPRAMDEMYEDFADILKVQDFIAEQWNDATASFVERIVTQVQDFLHAHEQRLRERSEQCYVVDGHGDLHSGNIFLLDEPVIFDCIEFNDAFRHVDMVDELAFLCLDLDFYEQPELEEHFLAHYLAKMPCIENDEDWQIYRYYKLYRANVRLKVACLKAENKGEFDGEGRAIADQYVTLLEKYAAAVF